MAHPINTYNINTKQKRLNIKTNKSLDEKTSPSKPKKPKLKELEMPAHFIGTEVPELWIEWIDHFRETFKINVSLASAQKQIKFLSQYTAIQAKEIIESAMRNNWRGLFPPKGQYGSKYLQPDTLPGALEMANELRRQRLEEENA